MIESDQKMTLIDIIKQSTTYVFRKTTNSQATCIRQMDKLDLIFGSYNVFQSVSESPSESPSVSENVSESPSESSSESSSYNFNRLDEVEFSIELID